MSGLMGLRIGYSVGPVDGRADNDGSLDGVCVGLNEMLGLVLGDPVGLLDAIGIGATDDRVVVGPTDGIRDGATESVAVGGTTAFPLGKYIEGADEKENFGCCDGDSLAEVFGVNDGKWLGAVLELATNKALGR